MILASTTGKVVGALFCLPALWLLSWVIQTVLRNSRVTRLKGPPSKSMIFGLSRDLHGDSSILYEQWANEFGPVYSVPTAFGSKRIVLRDPKAISHFYARETFTYVRSWMAKRGVERTFGRGLLWAEGESHKRQRKTLSPAFTNAAIRNSTPTFFDSGYKVKTAWDAMIESTKSGEAEIEVQTWMNHVSLDTIGIAGFSHDFRSLHGEVPEVLTVFESFTGVRPSVINIIVFILSPIFPILSYLPSTTKTLTTRLNRAMEAISRTLLANSRRVGTDKVEEKSAIGMLLKAEDQDKELHLSPEEVLAQMKVLLLAGYETTSISLTWALIELCRRQDVQDKLREELLPFSSSDPTWDQLTNSLPYLDSIVQEVLRVHPPLAETIGTAAVDDIIPLSNPIESRDGTLVDRIHVAAGTSVVVPIAAVNRSEVFWGPDAAEFKPERWLDENGVHDAKDLQGYRHIYTFSDGQRMCLGRGFALAEFKAVLCTLIRNFSFQFKAQGTEIQTVKGILPRPKVVGEDGARVPLLVRRVE